MNEVILVFDCQNSYLLETNFKLNVNSILKLFEEAVETVLVNYTKLKALKR